MSAAENPVLKLSPAEYDKWFREQVELALAEANNPNTVWYTQEEMQEKSRAWRAKWRAKARQAKTGSTP